MPKSKYFPFGFWNSPTAVVPPPAKISDGSDGDLVVLNGQVVQLTAGNIYSYNSINIQAGGVLEIVGIENAVTQVACKNSFVCDGIFRGKYTEVAVGNITLPADNWGLGSSYSHSQSQSSGGWGGCAWGSNNIAPTAGNLNKLGGGTLSYISATTPGWGGDQWAGNGGGGGGGLPEQSVADAWSNYQIGGCGGNIFDPTSPNRYTIPNQNGFIGSANGYPGALQDTVTGSFGDGGSYGGTGGIHGHGGICYAFAVTGSSPTDLSGLRSVFKGADGASGGGGCAIQEFKGTYGIQGYPGGAGGSRGEHGRRVFILAEEGISGSGLIDFAGNNGYNATQVYTPSPGSSGSTINSVGLLGGGGGGGAGGSGGAVWIRHSGTSTVTPTILTGAGSGGFRSRFNSQIGGWGEHPFGFSAGVTGSGTPQGTAYVYVGGMPRDGSAGGSGITNVQSY